MDTSSEKHWDGTEVEFTLVAKFRYKVDAEYYPGGTSSLEQAMAVDQKNMQSDPVGCLALEQLDPDTEVQYETTWRKI